MIGASLAGFAVAMRFGILVVSRPDARELIARGYIGDIWAWAAGSAMMAVFGAIVGGLLGWLIGALVGAIRRRQQGKRRKTA
jgi:membrane associated rhomboid family serine protease